MKPRGIVIHTVGVKGDTTMSAIRRYHTTPDDPKTKVIEGNGWTDAGYHRGISKGGKVECGRALWKTGAHTQGANDTWGVVVYGDGDSEQWTPAQWESVLGLCAEWCVLKGWDAEKVCGHWEAPARLGAEHTSKTCPGKLVDMNEVRRRLALRLKGQ
jgi:hypothetical protein